MTRAPSLAALALVGVFAVDAAAQPAVAQAEVLFRQAQALLAEGKIADACAAFDASQKLDPAVTTLLNQANCRQKNHQIATAWGLFVDAERQTRAATDEPTVQLHTTATNLAAKLEARLSTLTITVPGDSRVGGLEVLRNGEVIDLGMYNKALPVDGGEYRISARAPGNSEWSTTITVAIERDVKAVEVPRLKAAALGTPRPLPPPVPAPEHASKVVPLVVGVGAAAMLGTALAFSLWGDSNYSDARAEMTDQTRRDSLYDSANTKRYVAEGLVVGGAATAGIAIWLFLRHHDAESSTATARETQLVVSPAGLALIGAF